jgi:hypothetical protein
MTGYELTRQWWDFSFENQDLVGSKHCALYMWIIEKNNRLGWVENFGFPMDEAGAAIGIRKIQTVREALNDLVEWGFVRMVIKSQNQYKANVISIINCTIVSGDSLDNALRLTEKRLTTGSSTGQAQGRARVKQAVEHGSGTVPIVKQENNETNKPINQETDVDADRVDVKNGSSNHVKEKKPPPPKVAPKGPPTLHARIKEMIESLNPGYYWQAKDGKAAESLIKKIRHRWQNKHGSEATDDNVAESLQWVMDNLPEWYRNKWDTCTIESKFEAILKQITDDRTNGKSDNSGSTNATGVSSRLQSAWELLAQSRKARQPADGSD